MPSRKVFSIQPGFLQKEKNILALFFPEKHLLQSRKLRPKVWYVTGINQEIVILETQFQKATQVYFPHPKKNLLWHLVSFFAWHKRHNCKHYHNIKKKRVMDLSCHN